MWVELGDVLLLHTVKLVVDPVAAKLLDSVDIGDNLLDPV